MVQNVRRSGDGQNLALSKLYGGGVRRAGLLVRYQFLSSEARSTCYASGLGCMKQQVPSLALKQRAEDETANGRYLPPW